LPGFKGESWNPFVGCDIVSKGCTNCYAMKMAARLEAMSSRPDGTGNFHLDHYKGLTHNPRRTGYKPVWTGAVREASEKVWTAPLRAKKPRCYFVNSMGDVFHEDVPDEWIDRLFAVMALAPQHRFLILTKRPERMREYMQSRLTGARGKHHAPDDASVLIGAACQKIDPDPTINNPRHYAAHNKGFTWQVWEETLSNPANERIYSTWPLPNVWLGVSVEDQASADQRLDLLRATPAAIRFVSAEPLLGPVSMALDGLDWVIAGGESGPGARPMHPDWARGLRDQCAAAQVPFFFKQWGAWADHTAVHAESRACGASTGHIITPDGRTIGAGTRRFGGFVGEDWQEEGGAWMCRTGKGAAGHELDGRTHHAWPEVPA
jgi:protein gp37